MVNADARVRAWQILSHPGEEISLENCQTRPSSDVGKYKYAFDIFRHMCEIAPGVDFIRLVFDSDVDRQLWLHAVNAACHSQPSLQSSVAGRGYRTRESAEWLNCILQRFFHNIKWNQQILALVKEKLRAKLQLKVAERKLDGYLVRTARHLPDAHLSRARASTLRLCIYCRVDAACVRADGAAD
jgi:hypothetical protein